MSGKKAYIAYLRQSTTKQQASGLGIEGQREIIRNHIKEHVLLNEYVETESGKRSDRPELLKAIAECKKTGAVLIVAKLDRLSRNVAFMSRLLESDVEIVFCDFPEANKLILHVISSIAEYEATLCSTRTKNALKAKKARGYKLGTPENLIDNHQRAICNSVVTNRRKAQENQNNRRAKAMIEMMQKQGISLSAMARQLNEQGFRTSKGCTFTVVQVKRLTKRMD